MPSIARSKAYAIQMSLVGKAWAPDGDRTAPAHERNERPEMLRREMAYANEGRAGIFN